MAEFWKGVRNIGALIALIWAIIQIYNLIFVNRYDLKANADTSEFHIPKEALLADVGVNGINDYYYKGAMSSMVHRLGNLGLGINYQTKIIISNEGDNEIRDIKLLTNGISSIYEFENSEGVLKSGKTKARIPLGSLLANEKIEVLIWHDYKYTNDFSISFPEGSFEIEFSKRFSGTIASIANFFDIMDFWFLLFMIPSILSFIPTKKKSTSENKEIEKSSQTK